MVELKGVSKTYRRRDGGAVPALKDLSVAIGPGEFVAIRGPSGSGKSSFLNIVGCLDTPSSGTYLLDGEDVTRRGDRELSSLRGRKIGFIFQSFHLLPRTTALENVEIPMMYGDRGVDKERALAALERVGLGARARHLGTELSGGEQQRVAIARALINGPALILADEPTGNLDAASGREVMRLLAELKEDGKTVLLVTHDEVVAAQAERHLVLRDGRLVSDGPSGRGAQ